MLAWLCAACHDAAAGYAGQPVLQWSYKLGTARDLTADYIGGDTLICSSASSLDWVDVHSGRPRYTLSDPQMYGGNLLWFASPDGQVFYMLRSGMFYYNGNGQPQADVLSCRNSVGDLEWEISMPAGEQMISSAIGEDRIFLILSSGYVMAVSRSGDTLWYRQLDAVRLTGFAALISRQLVYLDRSGFLCVANEDGELIWRTDEKLGYYASTLELEDASLAVYDYPLALRYFDPAGRLVWRAEFPEYAPGHRNLRGGAGISAYNVDRMLDALPGNGCVVAHADGRLTAFDAAGRRLWRSRQTGQAPLICADRQGNVYASMQQDPLSALSGLQSGELYAWDARGRLAWRYKPPGSLNSAPSVDEFGQVYVETETDLYCLDPLWQQSK